MADAAEVKVKLVIDSNSEEETERLKKGLKGVGDAAGHAGKKLDVSLGGNLKSMKGLAMAAVGGVAAAAAAAAGALVGLGFEGVKTFSESSAQVRTLAGTFTLLSGRSDATFSEMKGHARVVFEQLQDMGAEVGVADEALVETFNNIIERGGKSVDQAMRLTESFAQAGRAIPGGAAAMSEAFSMVEMGMVRAKNPIVQMISATGMLKGNAKSVAHQMQQMTPEKQIELAEKAIEKMGKKMASTPLSFGEMKTSMSVMGKQILDGIGDPIMKAFVPAFAMVKGFFEENRGYLAEMAGKFGDVIGRGVEIGSAVVKELYSAFASNATEFQAAFDEFIGPAKELFEYIYENKETFAKTIADVALEIAKIAKAIMGAVQAVSSLIPKAAAFLGSKTQAGAEGTQETVRKKLSKEVAASGKEGLDPAEVKRRRDQFVEASRAAGLDVEKAGADFDTYFSRIAETHQNTMSQVGAQIQNIHGAEAGKMAAAFDLATKAHDAGAQKYVFGILDGNSQMRDALIKAGPEIFKTGVDGFMDALKASGRGDLAKQIQEGYTKVGLAQVGKGANINNNFSGPISIKQDFRDQDPDRIVLAFKDDLSKRASSRIGARGSSPLGGPFG